MMAIKKHDIYYESIVTRNLGESGVGCKGNILENTLPIKTSLQGLCSNGNGKFSLKKQRICKICGLISCTHEPSRADSKEGQNTSQQKKRIKLYNEDAKNYFCSFPTCSFASNEKQEFEDHFRSCHKKEKRYKNRTIDLNSTLRLDNLSFANNTTSMNKSFSYRDAIGQGKMQDQIDRRSKSCKKVRRNLNAKYDHIALLQTSNNSEESNELDPAGVNISDERKICKNVASASMASNHVCNKFKCESCRKTFGCKKYLKRHTERCHKQERTIQGRMDSEGDHDTPGEEKRSSQNYNCRLCMKNYKYESAWMKHMEQYHYKTISSWNGKEFVSAVKILLTPERKEKQKKDESNKKDPTLNEKHDVPISRRNKDEMSNTIVSGFCDGEGTGNINTKDGEKTSENTITTHTYEPNLSNLTLVHRNRIEVNSLSTDNSLAHNTNSDHIHCLTSFDRGFKKILQKTVSAINVENKNCNLHKLLSQDTEFMRKEGDYYHEPAIPNNYSKDSNINRNQKKDICRKEITKLQEQDDNVPLLISSLKSLSLTNEYKCKNNILNRDAAADALITKTLSNCDEEIRILHDEFVFQKVMTEILKNEAKIILGKVTIHTILVVCMVGYCCKYSHTYLICFKSKIVIMENKCFKVRTRFNYLKLY